MKQSEIVKEINNKLPNHKLAAVKYAYDIFSAAHKRNDNFGHLGLKESKDSIDEVQGHKNPGKKWIENLRINRPMLYKELRHIKEI